jgi:BlaI family transcriptional regulator, penicillinase repressor
VKGAEAVVSRRLAVSDTELEVLKVLWEQGPGTVREVGAVLRRQGRSWAYNTVLTLLQRLEAKGYVAADKSGLAHVFRPAVSRDELLRDHLRELTDQLCEGTPAPLVLALVEGHRFTAEEIAQLRQLLDRLEGKGRKK